MPVTTSLDYAVLYALFDVMDALGIIQRKNDIACAQRYLTWMGFKRLKEKYVHVFHMAKTNG